MTPYQGFIVGALANVYIVDRFGFGKVSSGHNFLKLLKQKRVLIGHGDRYVGVLLLINLDMILIVLYRRCLYSGGCIRHPIRCPSFSSIRDRLRHQWDRASSSGASTRANP